MEWVTSELESKTLTLARLRSLFGLKSSEKAKDLFPDQAEPDSGQAPDGGAGAAKDEADPRPPKPKGHGRNGADEYTGAETIEVDHESLTPGDPCPVHPPLTCA